MSDPLLQVIYVSSAVRPMSDDELLALLQRSRENNARVDVTGLLLYHDGNFMQALEGSAPAVDALHAKIGQDCRHVGMLTLLRRPIAQREFADWSMGFVNAARLSGNPSEGISNFFGQRATADDTTAGSRAHSLMSTFRRVVGRS